MKYLYLSLFTLLSFSSFSQCINKFPYKEDFEKFRKHKQHLVATHPLLETLQIDGFKTPMTMAIGERILLALLQPEPAQELLIQPQAMEREKTLTQAV